MTQTHPITPPPELRRQWLGNDHFPMVTGSHDLLSITRDRLNSVINQCAAWAADQELEACCEWLTSEYDDRGSVQALRLHCDRRPDPPTLKELAERILVENGVNLDGRMELDSDDIDTIARALRLIND